MYALALLALCACAALVAFVRTMMPASLPATHSANKKSRPRWQQPSRSLQPCSSRQQNGVPAPVVQNAISKFSAGCA